MVPSRSFMVIFLQWSILAIHFDSFGLGVRLESRFVSVP